MAQKAKADCENLENLLKGKQIEIQACKKEVELQRLEKENLEKRVSEVLHFLVAFNPTLLFNAAS